MAQKFLTNVELEAGLVDGSNSTGTSGYLLSSTGTATSWVDPAAVSVGESEQVHIACKNTSGVAISKGDPVYITGTVGASFKIQIAKADASVSTKMPAVGLAETDLAHNAEGFVIVSGILKNLTTDPLSASDGTPSSNDTVYVKAGGGLTRTKPTGSGNLIQNVGKVGRVNSASAGSLAVSTIMRTNDVPNLTTGKIWVGSPTYTTESTVVHLDEANGRMGIGTSSPATKLHIGPGTAPGTTTEELRIQTGTSSGYGGTAIVNLLTGQYGGSGIYFGDQATYSNQPAFIEYQDSPTTLTFKAPTTSGRQIFKIGTSEAMRIDYNSNVGIGTTSPSAKLHVYNTGNGEIEVERASGALVNIQAQSAKGLIGTDSNHTFSLKTNSSERLTILNSGNVGIGTSSPSQKLEVAGKLLVDNGNLGSVAGDTIYHAEITGARHHLDFKEVRTANGSDWPNTTYKLQMRVDSTNHQSIDFVSDANAQEHIDIYTGNQVFNTRFDANGNVGIGTASPGQKLHVAGNVEIDGEIHINNTSTKILEGNNNSVRVQTASGYVEIGPHNASYSHFYTDRGKFYFNAPIIVDSGIFAAYNEAMQLQAPYGSTRMYIDGSSGNVGIGNTNPGKKLDVAGDVRVDGLDNFLYTTNTNDIYTFGSSTQTMANAPNGYLWHDLLAFNYVYTTTQEVTSDGTNWSSTTLQKDLFAQKEGQAITVIGSTQTGVRWTFNNTAWGSAVLLNVAFTYVASDIDKNILVESSSNGTSWTTRFTNTATAGTSTKTCKLTSYSGDSYVRVTITKAVSSSNLVRMSQLRLMTLRAGDQGYGREYHLPITWDGDRNIGIKLASPTTSISEALEVNGSVKATADTDAYKGYLKQTVVTVGVEKIESTNYYYFPHNTTSTSTTSQYYNRMVAAYDGRIKKVYLRYSGGPTPTATAVNFKKEINNTVSGTVYAATVANSATTSMTAYRDFGNNDFTFSAGDLIGILYQTTDAFGTASKTMGQVAVTIIIEYNIT